MKWSYTRMNSSKHILLAVFLIQLSTCVFCESNVTEDAEQAIKLLDSQIVTSTIMMVQDGIKLWNFYVSDVNETIHHELLSDIENFGALHHNLTNFANITDNGTDCLSGLDVYLDLDQYDIQVVNSQEPVFRNLLSLADTELDYVVSQSYGLVSALVENCAGNPTDNCNGTSEFIVAEVERLVQIARRVPYDLLAEIHLLGYKLENDWATTQAIINANYSKAIRIATTCLALKFENYTEESIGPIPPDNFTSISDAYQKLLGDSEFTYHFSVKQLAYYFSNISALSEDDSESIIAEIQLALFKANRTVGALINFAEDLNITLDCSIPDLSTQLNSSVTRALKEYSQYIDATTIRHLEGVNYLNATLKETRTIGFQVQECDSSMNCDYVTEKLRRKILEIPLSLQRHGNATAILQHQLVTAVRESGYKIVGDVLDQLEAPITLLKDCLRGSLYQKDSTKYTKDYIIQDYLLK